MAISGALLRTQETWAFSDKWIPEIKQILKKTGLSGEDVENAMQDKFIENVVLDEVLQAQKRKIFQVPVFVIYSAHHEKEGEIFSDEMTLAEVKKIVTEVKTKK